MLALTVRLIFSLAVVVGLLLLITRLSARRMRGSADSLVKLVDRKALSRTSAILVVTVGDRVLVVGTTEHEVRLLTELDAADLGVLTARTQVPSAKQGANAGASAPSADTEHAAAALAARSVMPFSGALGGSVLSTQTWKQAYAAATGRVKEEA